MFQQQKLLEKQYKKSILLFKVKLVYSLK